ncbi:hypothetical protein [Halorarius halobius]|uniref:hypothetical protein n=1 Tax=Halorarius halobius TaxID=2962671 RepID=UPI0020CE44D2|nr:hypothetical protein [Halorarius halobius]
MINESEDVGEKAEIRRELRLYRGYVEDDDLRSRITDWIDESHELTEADTAERYVEQRLNELLEEYPMYHSTAQKRGEDAFPDECKECRHYGSSCPVLLDLVETDWRERRLEEAETEQEARRIYQQQARDVGCTRIPAYLNEYENEHEDFMREGQALVSEVLDAIHVDPADVSGEDVEVATDGGER